MIKLSDKSRKILRAIYRGLGVTAITLAVNSCEIIPPYQSWDEYGPGPDINREEILIRGQVKSKRTGEMIKGIAMYIEGIYNYPSMIYTGDFYFFVPVRNNYTIIFTDIDGEANGGKFKQYTLNLTREEAEAIRDNPLIIELEEEETDGK